MDTDFRVIYSDGVFDDLENVPAKAALAIIGRIDKLAVSLKWALLFKAANGSATVI